MSIYKFTAEGLEELSKTNFAHEGIQEVQDIQSRLCKQIEIIDSDLMVLTDEFRFSSWVESRRRVDILCIDTEGNLVVVELKRNEDGAHMDLQAIRYAAMVSNMTFSKAVETYEAFIKKHELEIEDPKQAILEFLDWTEDDIDEFAQEVRIYLVAADFSKELTTAVLWLNDHQLDIRCIKIAPFKDDETLYWQVQQVLPLPEASDYQVKQKEKASEERQIRESNRDYTKYDITINGVSKENLAKRNAMFFVVSEAVKAGISPELLKPFTKPRAWLTVNQVCTTVAEFVAIQSKRKYNASRWFNEDTDLMVVDGKTYMFSNQHGGDIARIVQQIFDTFSDKIRGEITLHS